MPDLSGFPDQPRKKKDFSGFPDQPKKTMENDLPESARIRIPEGVRLARPQAAKYVEGDIRAQLRPQGQPIDKQASQLALLADAFDNLPPNHPDRVLILNEMKSQAKAIEEREKMKKMVKDLPDHPAAAKAVVGAGTGFIKGITAGQVDLIEEYHKALNNAITSTATTPEARKSAEAMASISQAHIAKVINNPLYRISEFSGEMVGMAVPFTGLSKATAFIKLGKLFPQLSQSAQAFLRVGEGIAKESVIGAGYGGMRKLEEGEDRVKAIAQDAALFGIFGGVFNIKSALQIYKGSKSLDDFYRKMTRKVAEHPTGADKRVSGDDFIYFRENYGTRDNPVIMADENGVIQRFELGNDFWYGKESFEKMGKILDEAQKVKNAPRNAAEYQRLKGQLASEEIRTLWPARETRILGPKPAPKPARKAPVETKAPARGKVEKPAEKNIFEHIAVQQPKKKALDIKEAPRGKVRADALNKIATAHNEQGGSTINRRTGAPVTQGYAVSPYPNRTKVLKKEKITRSDLEAFIDANSNLLNKKGHTVGTWYDSESKATYLDIVITERSRDQAIKLGKKHNQKAIFDLKTFDEIPTGGTGKPTTAQLEHYSRQQDLKELDPEFFGSQFAGAELKRQRTDPKNFLLRTYYYRKGAKPEARFAGMRKYPAEIEEKYLYDLGPDPKGFIEKSNGDLTLAEKMISEAGFKGYYNSNSRLPDAVAIFEKLPVKGIKEVKQPLRGKVVRVPDFSSKTSSEIATRFGVEAKKDPEIIAALENKMLQNRQMARVAINNKNIKDAQRFTHRSAMYREAWEVATERMPESPADIATFFQKRKTFLESLDEMAARAQQRMKLRWDPDQAKFYGGLPVDVIKPILDLGDLSIIGAQRIIRGANSLAKFTKEMVKEYGPDVKKHIDDLYKKSKQHAKRFLEAAEKQGQKIPTLNKVLDIYHKGEYSAEWYNKTKPAVEKVFGEDADMFLKFVAITSPQTTPKSNVTKALELYKRWKLGQTSDEFMYGTRDQWKQFKNAIAGKEFETLKIKNFYKNLSGDLDAVTVDMWMAEIYFGKQNVTPNQYRFIEEEVRQLAKKVGKKPAEVQAAMWTGYKELPQNIKRGGEGSYEAIEKYVMQKFAASKHEAPNAWLLEQVTDRMAKTGVKQVRVELGSKNFTLGLMKAAAKDIKNTELGIVANPYKNMEDFLKKNKLFLTEEELQNIKTFMTQLANRKLVTREQTAREVDSFIERTFGAKFDVVSKARDITIKAKQEIHLSPDTRPWYIRWMDGELLQDANTRRVIRKAMGRRKAKVAQAVEASEERMKWFDKQPDDFNIQFMSAIEKGNVADPALKEIAKEYRKRLDRAWADSFVESAGRQAYIENYFPHIWKNPGAAKRWASHEYGGLLKNPSFQKKRYIEFIEDGLDAGLELRTTNPELLVLEREIQGFRYKETKDIIEGLRREGLLKFVPQGVRPPFDYRRLQTQDLKAFLKTPQGKTEVGEWWAPSRAVTVLDAHLSKGFWTLGETPFKEFRNKALRGVSMLKNNVVALKLGLSGFHFVETTTSSHATILGSALQAAARGDIRAAIAKFGQWTPVLGDMAVQRRGKDLYRAWKTGVARNDSERMFLQYIETAGGALDMAPQWKAGVGGQWKKAINNLKRGNPVGAVQVVPAIMEQMMKPLMEWWIPRLKAFNFNLMVEDYIKRNPQIRLHSERFERDIQKLWDSVDNRFGQLQYDNLFMNRFWRDVGVMSQISMGWNIGTYREFGGAAIDLTKASLRPFVKHNPEIVADRILYSAMYITHFAAIGGLMTYLLSGTYPEKVLDFFYPRTGFKNHDGTDERVQMPTMLKEWASSKEAMRKHGLAGPFVYAHHKLNPLVSMTVDLIQNENFYGVDIRDPHAPIFEQVEQLSQYLWEQGILPISISSFMRHRKATGSEELKDSILPFMGFSLAPGYVVKTPIQKEIFDLFQKRIPSGRSRAEWDRMKKRSEVKRLIADGRHEEGYSLFKKLKTEGVIPKDTKWSTYKKTYIQPSDIRAFKRLPKEDQDYLWNKMTDLEKAKYGDVYHKKVNSKKYLLR